MKILGTLKQGCAFILFLCSSSVSVAEIVNIEFTATFAGGTALTSYPLVFPGGFSFGDPVVGSYTYNTSVPDTYLDTNIGIYQDALIAFSLDFGNGFDSQISESATLGVVNFGSACLSCADSIGMTPPSPASSGTNVTLSDSYGNTGVYKPSTMHLYLNDTNSPVLESDSLIPILPTAFQGSQLGISYQLVSGDAVVYLGRVFNGFVLNARITSASYEPFSTDYPISVVDGGTAISPDGQLSVDIDPGDLTQNTTISVVQTSFNDPEVNLSIGTNPGAGQALEFYDLEPDGTQFANAVTLTITADVTALNATQRSKIDLYRLEDTDSDGIPETFVSLGATCSVTENPIATFHAVCTVQIDHFSTYAIVVPLDSDGDGVPNNFGEIADACSDEDASGFDADINGCIDSFSGLLDLVAKLVSKDVISTTMGNSLLSKVSNAENSIGRENVCVAINELEAFNNQVDAQIGKKISADAATQVKDYTDSVTLHLLSGLPSGEACN